MKQPKSIFERIALKWVKDENEYFESQENSGDYFKLDLVGNKRTGNQIKDWHPPSTREIEKIFANWDGKSELHFDLPTGGAINEFHKKLSGNDVPKTLPEIGQMELYKSSKLTDFISGSFLEQYGLMVNDKTLKLLTKFKIGNYNHFPFEVIQNGEILSNYNFLRNSASMENYIDYQKSKFYIQKGLLQFDTREDVDINSLDDINKLVKKVAGQDIYIFASELTVTKEFPNYDLFKAGIYGVRGIYISEKLKEALKECNGIEIKEQKRLKNWC
ncbi:hypothetical protein [Winogradskyella sp. MIT101101]|uniref:hypothetical protein n=1 Tax=Winogradskyella sp. MIT101101 TaxID=3098297 RepID=UPI00399B8A79